MDWSDALLFFRGGCWRCLYRRGQRGWPRERTGGTGGRPGARFAPNERKDKAQGPGAAGVTKRREKPLCTALIT